MKKEFMKSVLSIMLVMSIMLCAVPLGYATGNTAPADVFKMDTNYVKINSTEETYAMKLVDTTSGGTVTWSSSNTDVATVDTSGVVTPKAAGLAVITAASGENTCSATVRVREKLEYGVRISEPYIIGGAQGTTYTLTAEAAPGIDLSNAQWEVVERTNVNCSVAGNGATATVTMNDKATWNMMSMVKLTVGEYTDTCAVYSMQFDAISLYAHNGISYNEKNNKESLIGFSGYNYETNKVDELYTVQDFNGTKRWGTELGSISSTNIYVSEESGSAVIYRAPYTGELGIYINSGLSTASDAGIRINKNGEKVYPADENKEFLSLKDDTVKSGTILPLLSIDGVTDSNRYNRDGGLRLQVKAGDEIAVAAIYDEAQAEHSEGLQGWNQFIEFHYVTKEDEKHYVSLPNDKLYMGKGETTALGAVSDEAITYTSDNEEVATVDASGNVTTKADAAGACKIYAVSANAAACTDIIIGSGSEKLVLNTNSVKLAQNSTKQLEAMMLPNETTEGVVTEGIRFTSNNEAVATIAADGTITANGVGTAAITAAIAGIEAKCSVEVYDERLYFDETFVRLAGGESYTAVPKGTLAADGVTWSSDIAQITVADGVITAAATVSSGPAVVTATSTSNPDVSAKICIYRGSADNYYSQHTLTNYINKLITGNGYVNANTNIWEYGNSINTSSTETELHFLKHDYKAADVLTYYNTVWPGTNALWYSGATLSSLGYDLGQNRGLAHVFTAPQNGTVVLKQSSGASGTDAQGNAWDSDDKSLVTGAEDPGVTFEVRYNGTVIFSRDKLETFGEARRALNDNPITLNVVKGDKIAFVIRNMVASEKKIEFWATDGFKVEYTNVTAPASVDFGAENVSKMIGESIELPQDCNAAELVSTDTSIVTVDSATKEIRAVGLGTATVYAFNADKTLGDCITVRVNGITGATLIPDTDGKYKAEMYVSLDSHPKAMILAAVKNSDNVLVGSYVSEVKNIGTTDKTKFDIKGMEVAPTDTVMIYLWENTSSMKPVHAAIPAEIQQQQ